MDQINLQKKNNQCEICKVTLRYIDDIHLFTKNGIDKHTAIPCSHGQWYVLKDEFHWWSITPSSEDKGHSTF